MREITNGRDLNSALHAGKRFFSMSGPEGRSKFTSLLRMVHHVGGKTTIPELKKKDGSLLSLGEQIRSGAMTAGTDSDFGFILVSVHKAHFDEVTQNNWSDAARVQYAYEQLMTNALQEARANNLGRRMAIIFNFDNAPFSPDGVQFYPVDRFGL